MNQTIKALKAEERSRLIARGFWRIARCSMRRQLTSKQGQDQGKYISERDQKEQGSLTS